VKSLDPLREAPVPSEGEGLVPAKTNRISLELYKGTTILQNIRIFRRISFRI
jgi:hypothetical protein